jgi:spore germination protein
MRKLILVPLLCIAVGGMLYFLNFKGVGNVEPHQYTQQLLAGIDFSLPTSEPLNPAPAPTPISQSAWLPDWGIAGGINSAQNTSAAFYSFSPVWYYLNPDGSVAATPSLVAELKQLAATKGAKLIPSIASFEAKDIYNAIKPSAVDAHVQWLVDEVINRGFDGIDIDYEEFYYRHKDDYLAFVTKLSAALHANGKLLSITVHGDWSQADIHSTLRHTRAALDWVELNTAADEIRIMAYDFTGFRHQYPGPISPFDWNQAILRFAATNIDAQKIVLALPLYGYDGWSNNMQIAEPYLGMLANPKVGGVQADAATYVGYLNRRQTTVSDTLIHSSGEKMLIYAFGGKNYALTYQDVTNTKLKLDLAREYGIKGVAYWRLGDEDLGIYSLINQ